MRSSPNLQRCNMNMLSLGDLEAIEDRLSDIDGERPFVFHEVIDHGTEPITMDEYTHLGKVTEFNVGSWISCIKNNGFECYNGYPGVSVHVQCANALMIRWSRLSLMKWRLEILFVFLLL